MMTYIHTWNTWKNVQNLQFSFNSTQHICRNSQSAQSLQIFLFGFFLVYIVFRTRYALFALFFQSILMWQRLNITRHIQFAIVVHVDVHKFSHIIFPQNTQTYRQSEMKFVEYLCLAKSIQLFGYVCAVCCAHSASCLASWLVAAVDVTLLNWTAKCRCLLQSNLILIPVVCIYIYISTYTRDTTAFICAKGVRAKERQRKGQTECDKI